MTIFGTLQKVCANATEAAKKNSNENPIKAGRDAKKGNPAGAKWPAQNMREVYHGCTRSSGLPNGPTEVRHL